MQKLKFFVAALMIFSAEVIMAQTTTVVNHFDKVIISPHIEVTFVEGNEESVTIEKSTEDKEKINIEVNNKTLRVYLDGAKELTKNKRVYDDSYNRKQPIYKGTIVTATVTYKTMNNLSIRGEETQVCKSLLKGDKFRLKIYGESHVILAEVKLGELQTTIYGESILDIKSGSIDYQKYTTYGESKINSLPVNSNTARIIAYGESNFQVNTSKEIKITAIGEAKLEYKGNAVVNKGLHIGEMQIAKLD
jgi:hypothetical protein